MGLLDRLFGKSKPKPQVPTPQRRRQLQLKKIHVYMCGGVPPLEKAQSALLTVLAKAAPDEVMAIAKPLIETTRRTPMLALLPWEGDLDDADAHAAASSPNAAKTGGYTIQMEDGSTYRIFFFLYDAAVPPDRVQLCELCGREAYYHVQSSPKGDLDGKLVCKECSVPGMIASRV